MSKGLNREKYLSLNAAALECGVNGLHLCAVVSFETAGTFEAGIDAANSRAVGLIQFMPKTLKEYGYTREQADAMGFDEQVNKLVIPYLKRNLKNGTPYLLDLYMAVFCPRATYGPIGTVTYRAPSNNYKANSKLDVGKKGYITKGDCGVMIFPHLLSVIRKSSAWC